jgi:hypothetical protein
MRLRRGPGPPAGGPYTTADGSGERQVVGDREIADGAAMATTRGRIVKRHVVEDSNNILALKRGQHLGTFGHDRPAQQLALSNRSRHRDSGSTNQAWRA